MKFSICIPIYNTNANALVNSLVAEIETQNLTQVEVLVIDDASDNSYKEANRRLKDQCTYIELSENIGRSKIRNLFLKYAKGEYLLFLDGDSLMVHPENSLFITNYLTAIKEDTVCVCGGRVYPELNDISGIELNYLYGITKESKPVLERKKSPNQSFMTNNFLIKKEVLNTIRFDETLSQYGHEDTLFGIELMKNNYTVAHIDNPVLNGHIETNEAFLRKSQQALENLFQIYHSFEDKSLLRTHVKLLKWSNYMERFYLKNIFLIIFNRLETKWEQQFLKGEINLLKFDLYKLGFFLRLK